MVACAESAGDEGDRRDEGTPGDAAVRVNARPSTTRLFDVQTVDADQPVTITADRIEFDNKQRVAIFDGGVKVVHSQFNLMAEQVFVFLDEENELKHILAQETVVMTNENIRAVCDWALYTHAEGTLVMRATVEGNVAQITRGPMDTMFGYQITLWLEDERMEVVKFPDSSTQGTIIISPGTLRPGGVKKETPEPKEEPAETDAEPAPPARKPSLYKDPEAVEE